MRRNRAGQITILVLLILVAAGIYALLTGRLPLPDVISEPNPQNVLEMARSRVEVGDSRDSAVSSFSDAWFHTECLSTDRGLDDDLFFYGPHNPDTVRIVIVRSENDGEVATVAFVGTVENYMLHLYDHCVPLPTSAFTDSDS
jgi:hypothetical protein